MYDDSSLLRDWRCVALAVRGFGCYNRTIELVSVISSILALHVRSSEYSTQGVTIIAKRTEKYTGLKNGRNG